VQLPASDLDPEGGARLSYQQAQNISRRRPGDNPLYHPVNVGAWRYHSGHAR
jgi:hypothetical protein